VRVVEPQWGEEDAAGSGRRKDLYRRSDALNSEMAEHIPDGNPEEDDERKGFGYCETIDVPPDCWFL